MSLGKKPLRVLHPITRMIVGGAQENTMLTALHHNYHPDFSGLYEVEIVCGPQTGEEGSLIEETQQQGIPLTILPEMVREISPVKDITALWKLYRLMRQKRYDIVHTHSSKAGLLGRLAAKWAGVPVIIHTVHGWSFHDQMTQKQLQVYLALEKIGHAVGHASIVVSPRDITKGVAQGIGRAEDYTLVRSGIELDRFGHPQIAPADMRQQLGIPQEALVVGSVTRLSPQKAPLDLVKALALIAQKHPQTWFVIVGDGSLRPQVEQALQEANLTQQTILTGVRRDVPELMATFNIFLLSSLWEGLPRVLPQAMATSLPIVCTEADGSAEAVTQGVNGFLVPKGTPAGLAHYVTQLLEQPELRQQMGHNGRAKAPEFSALKMVHDLHLLYQSLHKTSVPT